MQYAERATQAEGKVNELESRLAVLEMGPPPNTTTNWIISPTNGICHDARRTSHTYLHPDSASIPTAETKKNGGKRNNNDYNRGGQRRLTKKYQGGGRGGGYRGDHHNANNTQKAYFNAINQNNNLLYCFSCGYDVDHDGSKSPPLCQKQIHLPNVKCDEADMYQGACMRTQHKTLPDGTGV